MLKQYRKMILIGFQDQQRPPLNIYNLMKTSCSTTAIRVLSLSLLVPRRVAPSANYVLLIEFRDELNTAFIDCHP